MDEQRSARERITLWVTGAAAAITACYTFALLVLVDRIILIHQFKHGALTPWIILATAVWAVWIVILLRPRHSLRWAQWGIGVLCVSSLTALAWTTFNGQTEIEEVRPGPGRFQQSAPPSSTPSIPTPPSDPTQHP
jgi:hypothetical protein